MTWVEAEPPDQGLVGEMAQRVPRLHIVPTEGETSEQLTDITSAQDFLDQTRLQLGDPLSSQVTERHGAGFISAGAVSRVDLLVRSSFGTHSAETEANAELKKLIEAIKNERRSRLLVRVGSQAVLPFIIDGFEPGRVAEPFSKKHTLGQGSMFELTDIYEDVITHHGRSSHDREAQPYAGRYRTFLPIAWIGRILKDEGELVIKLNEPNKLF